MASLTDSMDALTTAAPPFVCGITREMPEKPVELEGCGHVFDQDALRRWRAAGKTRCPECCGPLDSRPSSVVAASLRAYRARSRRDAAVERDDIVVAKGRPLGRGSHGVVKKASWRGHPVAVKQVPLDDDEAAVAMQRELKALRALRHPNVVALLGALTDDDEGLLWAVLEFAPHGSLHKMLHRSSESDMRACFGDAKALPGLGEAFWGVAGDVCAALAFLHRRSVIHGDVKAANVLLGNGGVAKISDFGLARVVGTAGFTRTSSSHGGTTRCPSAFDLASMASRRDAPPCYRRDTLASRRYCGLHGSRIGRGGRARPRRGLGGRLRRGGPIGRGAHGRRAVRRRS